MSNTEASLEGSFSPPLTDSQNSTAAGASSQVNKSKGTSVKRKAMAPRSEVWSHFTKFVTSKGESKGRCNYCDKEFCCDMKKNGTGSLKYHMMQCKKNPTNMVDTNQRQLVLPSKGSEGEVGHITNWKFDQEAVRKALAQMIVIGELPFKFVESEGFRKFMSVACPRFRIPSRFTITRDVYQLYLDERIKLKQYLKSSCSKLSVDIDFSVMAMRMKDKFDKYWGDIDKMNMLIFGACVMDLRQKLNYPEFALIEMYNAEKSSEVMQKLKDTLFELYDGYKPQVSSDRGQSSVEKHTPSSEPQQKVKRRMKYLYKRRVAENGDYIRNSSTEEEIKKIEEQIEELDKIDNDLSWNTLEPTLNS
ncbi:hypothetical protein V6N13_033891 [Hibiscus sabdariffa]